MQADTDGQLQSGDGRQIGNPLLHVDGGLAGILGRLEGGKQLVARRLHCPAAVAVDRALHAFQAALDGMNRFGIPQPLEKRGTAGDIGVHHDLVSGAGAHGRRFGLNLLKLRL